MASANFLGRLFYMTPGAFPIVPCDFFVEALLMILNDFMIHAVVFAMRDEFLSLSNDCTNMTLLYDS